MKEGNLEEHFVFYSINKHIASNGNSNANVKSKAYFTVNGYYLYRYTDSDMEESLTTQAKCTWKHYIKFSVY